MAAEPEAFLVPPPPSSSSTTGGVREEEEASPAAEAPRPRNGFRSAGGGKRRSSCGAKQPAWKRRRRAASECGPVLPSEFLLGGNIFDPLNLNSLLDEEVSRALNARTPQSSPLPARGRDPVEILVPRDITDPLSLNAPGEGLRLASPAKTARRRHRHRGQQRAAAAVTATATDEAACPHVLPAATTAATPPPCATACPATGRHRKRRRTCSKSEGTRPPPEKPKPPGKVSQQQRQRRQVQKFQYGNYCKYYGYRNPDCEDGRLRAMRPEWFAGKEVLDVGCNVGHLTLSIAKRWGPARVVGLDIDGGLIRSARQNIRHYLSEEIQAEAAGVGGGNSGGGARKGFPAALLASRGPIAAPRLPPDGPGAADFPHNVVFVTGWKHSPTICHGLIQTALEKGEAPEPLQYIDDIIIRDNTAEEVFEKRKKIVQIFLKAGFAIKENIAVRIEKLVVKVRHVDAHVPKSQATEEDQSNQQADQATKIKVSQVDLDWHHKGELFMARWAHDTSGHQGRDATYRWARDRGVDLTMDTIAQVIHECETCAAIKQASG
ncbi:PREDICTED: 7SK snRNA methylphosphate capping enzyme [Haliaeetus leucocephalus]|uniref:7SK snRNA methylphosphate capping enzyme n=1 Tax=Haliaeetus leucocephalus TaxID=52644 RepID=UPI00053CC020|nr:PREDICTED: 7SK snRNA methylphosphate capping enzyme [Haliaeetus leucocephalus]